MAFSFENFEIIDLTEGSLSAIWWLMNDKYLYRKMEDGAGSGRPLCRRISNDQGTEKFEPLLNRPSDAQKEIEERLGVKTTGDEAQVLRVVRGKRGRAGYWERVEGCLLQEYRQMPPELERLLGIPSKTDNAPFQERLAPNTTPNADALAFLISPLKAQAWIYDLCDAMGMNIEDFYDHPQLTQRLLQYSSDQKRVMHFAIESFLEGNKRFQQDLLPTAFELLSQSLKDAPNLLTAYRLSQILYKQGRYFESHLLLHTYSQHYSDPANRFVSALIHLQMYETLFEQARYNEAANELENAKSCTEFLTEPQKSRVLGILFYCGVCLALRQHESKDVRQKEVSSAFAILDKFITEKVNGGAHHLLYLKLATDNIKDQYDTKTDELVESLFEVGIPYMPTSTIPQEINDYLQHPDRGNLMESKPRFGRYVASYYDDVLDLLYFTHDSQTGPLGQGQNEYIEAIKFYSQANFDAQFHHLKLAIAHFQQVSINQRQHFSDRYRLARCEFFLASAYHMKHRTGDNSSDWISLEVQALQRCLKISQRHGFAMMTVAASRRLGHKLPSEL